MSTSENVKSQPTADAMHDTYHELSSRIDATNQPNHELTLRPLFRLSMTEKSIIDDCRIELKRHVSQKHSQNGI